MRFTPRTLLLTLLATLTTAQENAFNVPPGGYAGISAGSTVPLTWTPTTGGKVTLILRSGDAQNLAEGTLIASDVENNSAFTWKVPGIVTKGAAYTVQIVAGEDVNYTPYFPIDSPNTAPSSTSLIPTGAPTGSADRPALPESAQKAQASITAGQSNPNAAAATATATGTTAGATGSNAAQRLGGSAGGMAAGALVVALAGGVLVL